MSKRYRCGACGGEFVTSPDWTDDDAHAEALAAFGKDGTDPSMVEVCDDCYRKMMGAPLPASSNFTEAYLQAFAAVDSDGFTQALHSPEGLRAAEDLMHASMADARVRLEECLVGHSPLQLAAADDDAADPDDGSPLPGTASHSVEEVLTDDDRARLDDARQDDDADDADQEDDPA